MIGLLVKVCGDLLRKLTRPWRQLFWLSLHLYISVWSVVLNRVSEVLGQSIRFLTAFRREKELEVQLFALKLEYEDTILRNSELQKKLNAFTRDRRRIIDTLDLVTGDKRKIVETAKALKIRVQELEYENRRLIENEDDLRRGLAQAVARVTAANKLFAENKFLQYEYSALDSEYVQAKDLASKALHDIRIKDGYQETLYDMKSSRTQPPCSMKVGSVGIKRPLIAESEQGVAFSSSVFSALLSTLVAMIAWEAQDPCTPLVVALFTVVGMSLANVIRFFTKVQSRQGFYAVALLSLNWFVLGTLAHPALPYVGQFGSGILWIVGGQFFRLFGFGSVLRAVKVTSHELLSDL